MTNDTKEFTLRAYLDILRRQRWLILGLALICAIAGYSYSKLQSTSYSASATLSVNDPSADLALFGGSSFSGKTPLQEATAASQQATRPEVTAEVGRNLHTTDLGSVSTSVDPNSYVVTITADNGSATNAAAVANAFATADASLTNSETRKRYAAQASTVSTQLHHLSKNPLLAYNVVAAYTRLKSLSQVASPMSVATTASVPTSLSSPSTAVITLGALIFGLLLGVAVATGRDALDRRLRHARDVAKVLDQPVIGHIRTDALGHSGAPAESANGVGPLEDPDQESFRILRQNIAYLGVTSKSVVLVTSAVAQEGKSTVAACLAVATAETGNRTLLVECDLRKPVLAKRLGLNATPGLTDYLTGHAEPHAILQTVPGISERLNGGRAAISGGAAGTANLVCITAGTTVHRPAELLASERFRTFLTDVSGVYDTVILDAAPLLPVADTLAIVPDASALVMCVRLGHTTRDQARGARAALGRLPERPVGVVITGVGQAQDGYYYQGDYSLPAPVSA